jgi:hypothetical protein
VISKVDGKFVLRLIIPAGSQDAQWQIFFSTFFAL